MGTLEKLQKYFISDFLKRLLFQNLNRSTIRYDWKNLVWETPGFFETKEAGNSIIWQQREQNVD